MADCCQIENRFLGIMQQPVAKVCMVKQFFAEFRQCDRYPRATERISCFHAVWVSLNGDRSSSKLPHYISVLRTAIASPGESKIITVATIAMSLGMADLMPYDPAMIFDFSPHICIRGMREWLLAFSFLPIPISFIPIPMPAKRLFPFPYYPI